MMRKVTEMPVCILCVCVCRGVRISVWTFVLKDKASERERMRGYVSVPEVTEKGYS